MARAVPGTPSVEEAEGVIGTNMMVAGFLAVPSLMDLATAPSTPGDSDAEHMSSAMERAPGLRKVFTAY
jgi:hypothetical protein